MEQIEQSDTTFNISWDNGELQVNDSTIVEQIITDRQTVHLHTSNGNYIGLYSPAQSMNLKDVLSFYSDELVNHSTIRVIIANNRTDASRFEI